jgi:LmbE family N-acetylglucosaminyl deacetylase
VGVVISEEKMINREQAIQAVSAAYPFERVLRPALPTLELDHLKRKEIVRVIGQAVREVQADVLYIPFEGDVHSDHQVAAQAAWAVSKSFRYPTVREVYAYETVSETEFGNPSGMPFQPNTFVEISPFFERKLEITALYKDEMGEHPFPRSSEHLRALAVHRGVAAGVKLAEAFVCLKRVIG